MKLTKEKVCVFIEDEQQLEQAMKLLVKYGQRIENDLFNLINANYLIYDPQACDWWIIPNSIFMNRRTKITLTELEQILKDGSTKQD